MSAGPRLRPCEACGGSGSVIIGSGFVPLERLYPELPIREMERRGWLGDIGDGEDAARVEAGFLAFWGASSHAEVRERLTGRWLS